MCNPIQIVSDFVADVGDTIDHALNVTGKALEEKPLETLATAAVIGAGGYALAGGFSAGAGAASAGGLAFAEGAAATSATAGASGAALLPLEAATVTSWGPVASVTAGSAAASAITAAGVLEGIASGATSIAKTAGTVAALGNLVSPRPSGSVNPFADRVAVQPVYLPASQEGYASGGIKNAADYGRASDAAGVAAIAAQPQQLGMVEILGLAGVAGLLIWGMKK